MEPEFPADLIESFERPTMQVKNVSARAYAHVYNSHVYSFKPGETKIVREQLGRPKDEFGRDEVPPNYDARGPDGKRLHAEVALVVVQAGDLDSIWKNMDAKKGNPLVRLRGDGKDLAREDWKLKSHSAHALKEARYIVDQWLKRCRDNVANGNPVEDKPVYVFDAEQDIILFSKNTDEKRFKVTLDGSRFNTKAECEQHIKKTPWLSQHADVWQNYIQDMKGGDMLSQAAPVDALTDHEPEEGIPQGGVSEQGSEPSAATRGILRLADKSGKILPPELVARLDGPESEAAVEAAMDIILSPQSKEEKARAKAFNASQEKGTAA